MEFRKISSNATAFIYDNIENYLTNVFIVEGESKVFVIDTFCGSGYMEPVLKELSRYSGRKEIVVINTHFHWDHIWGNCSFPGKNIISHSLCRQDIEEHWEAEFARNSRYVSGKAEKCLPNITFQDTLSFHNDGIELFHSPGHTADSISIFDHKEKVLYAGDNIEKPIIYVEHADLDTYIRTLENYLSYNPEKIAAGHTLDLTPEDLHAAVDYLKGLKNGRIMHFETEYEREVHAENLRIINRL